MGLASKLAAAQSNPNYYGPPGAGGAGAGGYPGQAPPGQYPGYPPQGQGQPGQKPGAYQPQQYQPYSAAGGAGAKPPGAPGAPGQYGAPQQPGQYPGQQPMGGQPLPPQVVQSILQQTIIDNKIQHFYPPDRLNRIIPTITGQVDQLCQQWRVPREVGSDLIKLALFDIILYIDDSGSMAFEENGERIKDLKVILQKVAFAATLFDQDGISLRFMNNEFAQNNIRTEAQVNQVVDQISFRGLTPMGTALRQKVVDPLIVAPARAGNLAKPLLVITITDGQPAGEAENAVQEAILYAESQLRTTPYGPGAASFQFAQVGNDLRAREFLAKLDKDPRVGQLIDCTSNYEVEADEMAKASPPVNLTPELWLTKLLLGAIDSSYDRKDESANHPQAGGFAPPGQYGAPPPGQYGAPPPGQYGAPPPGQYGAPGQYGGAPPQQPGQYGAPGQYGGAPPQQQGYGGAPPQGGYGQPGGYGGQPGQYGGAGGYGGQPGQYR